MSIRRMFAGMDISRPGHYGPHCTDCNAPIMFNEIRKRNCKCDKCNGFKVHECDSAMSQLLRYDPNIENSVSPRIWLDKGVWYAELSDNSVTTNFYPLYHFRVLNCPFCGIDLKTLEK